MTFLICDLSISYPLVLMESSNLLARVKSLHDSWPWVIFPGICTWRRFLRIISTFSRNHSWPHGVVVTEKAHRYLILWYGYTWVHLTFSSSPRINNYQIENFAAWHKKSNILNPKGNQNPKSVNLSTPARAQTCKRFHQQSHNPFLCFASHILSQPWIQTSSFFFIQLNLEVTPHRQGLKFWT